MIKFHEISIKGMFGRFDVTLPINDNRIIIVGHNGIGKSTILNAFYYVISAQWEKLIETYFQKLELRADNQVFTIERDWLLGMDWHRPRTLLEMYGDSSSSKVNSRIATRITNRDLRVLSDSAITTSMMRPISHKYGVPISVVEELHHLLSFHSIDSIDLRPELRDVEEYFDDNLDGRILYLPIYRRIEKDIKSIFPEIEDEIQRAIRLRRVSDFGSRAELYVELVNFEMEDVYEMIQKKMEVLRSLALSEIRSLSTLYLRDVIKNVANTYNSSRVGNFDRRDLKRIFANVDESVLSQPDQAMIYNVVDKINTGAGIEENEKYVAHYISLLIDIWEKIASREKPVHEFARICESYLFGKRFRFESTGYSLPIEYAEGDSVRMEDLSSGEKQIVSLFAHMTLDERPSNYVIIDEPELSLSVDWQQKLLQDISDLDSCAFVGAVTHSPFVFENNLDEYAVDMTSCIDQ